MLYRANRKEKNIHWRVQRGAASTLCLPETLLDMKLMRTLFKMHQCYVGLWREGVELWRLELFEVHWLQISCSTGGNTAPFWWQWQQKREAFHKKPSILVIDENQEEQWGQGTYTQICRSFTMSSLIKMKFCASHGKVQKRADDVKNCELNQC